MFALGAYAVLGDQIVAAAGGVTVMVLLAARTPMHRFLRKLTWPELRSAILLLAMAFVLLPFLPNRTLDPWDAFNPYELWLITVVCSRRSVSRAMWRSAPWRALGLLVVATVAGSFVSSTTVTVMNARLAARVAASKKYPFLALTICIAWITSIFAHEALGIGINRALLTALLPPVHRSNRRARIAALYFYWQSKPDHDRAKPTFSNPLDLKFVLSLGALIAVIAVAAKAASEALGQAGLLAVAGLSGFADVDPVTVSSARLAGSIDHGSIRPHKRFCLQQARIW